MTKATSAHFWAGGGSRIEVEGFGWKSLSPVGGKKWKAIEHEDDKGKKHLSGIRLMSSHCATHATPTTATTATTATTIQTETIMPVMCK